MISLFDICLILFERKEEIENAHEMKLQFISLVIHWLRMSWTKKWHSPRSTIAPLPSFPLHMPNAVMFSSRVNSLLNLLLRWSIVPMQIAMLSYQIWNLMNAQKSVKMNYLNCAHILLCRSVSIYLTTASTNCCPFGTFRLHSGKNSFASYFARIHFSRSSRDDFGVGLTCPFRIVAS